MKKSVQKINESQLRAIVAESIKKALNEIDWKTYRNAQEKNKDNEWKYKQECDRLLNMAYAAEERGDNEKADKLRKKAEVIRSKRWRTDDFGQAARDAFFNTHFQSIYNDYNNTDLDAMPLYTTDDGSWASEEPAWDGGQYFYPYSSGHGKVDGKYFDDNIEHHVGSKKHNFKQNDYTGYDINGSDNDSVSQDTLRSYGYNDKHINDIEDARREIRNYRNGNYEYNNGKGWQLKKK